MKIENVKRALGISNSDIAEFFGYNTTDSYQNSTKKPVIEKAICELYDKFLERSKNPTIENLNQ